MLTFCVLGSCLVLQRRNHASMFPKATRSWTRWDNFTAPGRRLSPLTAAFFQVVFNPWSESRRGDKVPSPVSKHRFSLTFAQGPDFDDDGQAPSACMAGANRLDV
jgi:hypothetical protein